METKLKQEPVADGGGMPPEIDELKRHLESSKVISVGIMAVRPEALSVLLAAYASSQEALRAALTLLRKFIPACGCALGDCNNCTEAKALFPPEGSSRPAEKKKEPNDDWNDWDNGGGFDVAGK